MARFDLLAAIDLRMGRVVRLREGDFERETSYSDDPAGVGASFAEQGVRWFHVVDLDGALAGTPVQVGTIRGLIEALGDRAAVEVAGGLRSLEAVAGVLSGGAARAVIGSAAIADPGFAAEAVARHGDDRIAVALDVRGGRAIGQAWRRGAEGVEVGSAVERLLEDGVRCFEVTAIERDGSLEGPDIDLLQSVVARAGTASVIASGGIATVEDLLATWAVGCAGAIVGRGLYEGTFDLGRAIRATADGT